MAAPTPIKDRPHFVLNALGQSAHRKGPFVNREAALTWARTHYKDFPAWIVPCEPANGPAEKHRLNDAEGQPIQEG